MTYHFAITDDERAQVDSIITARGCRPINWVTGAVMGAWDDDGKLVGLLGLQPLLSCGPHWVDESAQGKGMVILHLVKELNQSLSAFPGTEYFMGTADEQFIRVAPRLGFEDTHETLFVRRF